MVCCRETNLTYCQQNTHLTSECIIYEFVIVFVSEEYFRITYYFLYSDIIFPKFQRNKHHSSILVMKATSLLRKSVKSYHARHQILKCSILNFVIFQLYISQIIVEHSSRILIWNKLLSKVISVWAERLATGRTVWG
jgi:hypothetical protein